jgi:hypothetical protein
LRRHDSRRSGISRLIIKLLAPRRDNTSYVFVAYVNCVSSGSRMLLSGSGESCASCDGCLAEDVFEPRSNLDNDWLDPVVADSDANA